MAEPAFLSTAPPGKSQGHETDHYAAARRQCVRFHWLQYRQYIGTDTIIVTIRGVYGHDRACHELLESLFPPPVSCDATRELSPGGLSKRQQFEGTR